MNQIYIISLGSNQGNSLAILRQAAVTLEAAEGLHIEKKSAIYETLPWGKTDQPVFLNAVMEISWEGPAEDLMALLLSVEKQFGRTRDVHWGPRTLDLDLIYSDGIQSDTPFLHLPHPYFWERPFVLVPMADVCPDFMYQGTSILSRIWTLHGEKEVKRTAYGWEGEE